MRGDAFSRQRESYFLRPALSRAVRGRSSPVREPSADCRSSAGRLRDLVQARAHLISQASTPFAGDVEELVAAGRADLVLSEEANAHPTRETNPAAHWLSDVCFALRPGPACEGHPDIAALELHRWHRSAKQARSRGREQRPVRSSPAAGNQVARCTPRGCRKASIKRIAPASPGVGDLRVAYAERGSALYLDLTWTTSRADRLWAMRALVVDEARATPGSNDRSNRGGGARASPVAPSAMEKKPEGRLPTRYLETCRGAHTLAPSRDRSGRREGGPSDSPLA